LCLHRARREKLTGGKGLLRLLQLLQGKEKKELHPTVNPAEKDYLRDARKERQQDLEGGDFFLPDTPEGG